MKLTEYYQKHRKQVTAAVALLAVLSLGYGYRSYATPKVSAKYILGQPTRGLFIASLSGTGQVSGESQIDIKPKVAGDVLKILVKEGQAVKKDDPLVELDPKEAQKTVRDAALNVHDAQIALDSAKLSLAKLQEPATQTQLLQAEHAVNQARRALETLTKPPDAYELKQAEAQVANAEQNAKISSDGVTPQVVRNAYDNAVVNLTSAMQMTNNALLDADSILGVDNTAGNLAFEDLLSILDQSHKNRAIAEYVIAKPAVKKAKLLAEALHPTNEVPDQIEAGIIAAQDAITKTSVVLTDVLNALNATLTSASFTQANLQNLKSTIQGDQTSLSAKQSSLMSQSQAIEQAKTTYQNAGTSLAQAKLALEKLQEPADSREVQNAQDRITEAERQLIDLKAGATTIDIQMAQNTIAARASAVASAVNRWQDAKRTLEEFTVRAPMEGIVAKLPLTVTEAAGSGATVVTIVAQQQIVEMTLNEVDAAKVHVGQKASVTFDAVEDLTLTGVVDEVGTIGTASQGVVSYAMKIGLDAQDERIKPGMSARASIVTETVPDAMMVPNAAVKAQGVQKYVQVMDMTTASVAVTSTGAVTGTPHQVSVQVGSSNDSVTVITAGLTGDEQIVTQIIQPTTTKTATTANVSRVGGIPGMSGMGGGR